MSKADWEKGIAIIRAFGRTDYMYVKEVAPPAYDSINDRIKVAIETAVPLTLEDDWARELGQVDIARILGAAPAAANPLPTRLSDGSAYIDPRDRNWTITEEVPVSATDLDIRDLQKALDEVYGVLRTDLGVAYDARDRNWALGDTDIPDLKDKAARQLGIIYGDKGQLAQRTTSLDLYAALRYSGAEIDPRSIRALDYSTDDLLVYGDVGQLAQRAVSKDALVQLRHEGAEINPQTIRALTSSDIVTTYLSKIGTTALTPRDWSLDFKALAEASVAGNVKASIGFYYSYQYVNILTGANAYIKIANPAASGKNLILFLNTSSCFLTASPYTGQPFASIIYYGATDAASPDAHTALPLDIGSGAVSAMTLTGKAVAPGAYGTRLYAMESPNVTLETSPEFKVKLRPGQNLCVVTTNLHSATCNLHFGIYWWEETI